MTFSAALGNMSKLYCARLHENSRHGRIFKRAWILLIWLNEIVDMPFPQVQELYGQVRDYFCQLQDLCAQVAGLWRGLHAMSGRTSEAVLSRWICRLLFWTCPLRARIYVFISPKKHSNPSHRACFLLIFSVFGVKGWILKHSHGRWMPVMCGGSKPSHRNTASKPGSKW